MTTNQQLASDTSTALRAREILFRVWVSEGIVTPEDITWLRARRLEHESPVDACFRMAGYPDHSRESTADQYRFLEALREEARVEGRAVCDKRWGKDVKGRWVLDRDAKKDEYGRTLESRYTYLPPDKLSEEALA